MRPNSYLCLDCGQSTLESVEQGQKCPACGKLWPVHGGVSLFLKGLKVVENAFSMPEESWKAVCHSAGLSPSAEHINQLQTIFSNNYNLPELHLCAENNYYFQRVPGLKDFSSASQSTKAPDAPLPLLTSAPYQFQIERHYIPECIPAGQTHPWNVRLKNDGRTITSHGPNAVRLAHRWRDGTGNLVHVEGQLTTLPVAMAKGRSLTLPMFIATPMRTGLHLMEVGLVDESGRWFSAKGDPILVQCVVGLFLEVPSHWTNLNKPQSTYDYVEDHHLGVAFLKEELKGNDCPRLLEVGGCSSPMTHGFAGDIYVSDIDAQTLQVGQMRFGSKFPNMNFLASDAARLPFNPGTFDGVVLFATLHHFADPIGCLKEFRRVLKPDGFVMMGTEPVGTYMAETVDSKLLKELESGINEQVFTTQEYQRMFLSAGLFATKVEIDRGALRAILRPLADGQSYSAIPDGSTTMLLIRQLVKLNLYWAKEKVKKYIKPLLPRRKAA